MSQWRRLKKKCSRYLQEKGFSFVLYILGNIFAQHLFSLSGVSTVQMVVMMASAALSAATFSFLTSFSRWMLKLLSPLLLIIFAIKSFNFSLFLSLSFSFKFTKCCRSFAVVVVVIFTNQLWRGLFRLAALPFTTLDNRFQSILTQFFTLKASIYYWLLTIFSYPQKEIDWQIFLNLKWWTFEYCRCHWCSEPPKKKNTNKNFNQKNSKNENIRYFLSFGILIFTTTF